MTTNICSKLAKVFAVALVSVGTTQVAFAGPPASQTNIIKPVIINKPTVNKPTVNITVQAPRPRPTGVYVGAPIYAPTYSVPAYGVPSYSVPSYVPVSSPSVSASSADTYTMNKAARLGFTGEILPEGGFKVNVVDANGPADAAGFQVGDVIVNVDGIAINTFDDALRAVRSARGRMMFDIVDATTGETVRRWLAR